MSGMKRPGTDNIEGKDLLKQSLRLEDSSFVAPEAGKGNRMLTEGEILKREQAAEAVEAQKQEKADRAEDEFQKYMETIHGKIEGGTK